MPKGTSGKLKATRAPAQQKPKPYKVRTGTRNGMGPTRQFATMSSAKDAAMAALYEWETWCDRYNKAGKAAIYDARKLVDEFSAATAGSLHRVECNYDEHTGAHLVIEMWRKD